MSHPYARQLHRSHSVSSAKRSVLITASSLYSKSKQERTNLTFVSWQLDDSHDGRDATEVSGCSHVLPQVSLTCGSQKFVENKVTGQ